MLTFLIFIRNFFFIPAVVAGVFGALFLWFYPFYWVFYHYLCDDAPNAAARNNASLFFGGIAGVITFILFICAYNMTEDDLKDKAKKPKKEKPAKPAKVKKDKEDKSWLNS